MYYCYCCYYYYYYYSYCYYCYRLLLLLYHSLAAASRSLVLSFWRLASSLSKTSQKILDWKISRFALQNTPPDFFLGRQSPSSAFPFFRSIAARDVCRPRGGVGEALRRDSGRRSASTDGFRPRVRGIRRGITVDVLQPRVL